MSSPNKKEWKNPKDVMKIHRIKRQSSSGSPYVNPTLKASFSRRHSFTSLHRNGLDIEENAMLSHTKSDASRHSQPESLQQKRKNPFGYHMTQSSQSKRRAGVNLSAEPSNFTDSTEKIVISPVTASATCQTFSDTNSSAGTSVVNSKEHKLLHMLNMAELATDSESCQSHSENTTSSVAPIGAYNILKEKDVSLNTVGTDLSQGMANQVQAAKIHSIPPLDWSLKSKLRVTVHNSDDAFKKYPGIDAKHVDSFVHHILEDGYEWSDLDVLQKIKRCCMHYSYPHLPWLPSFPRLSSDYKQRSASVIANNEEALESLQKDWSSTLTSVYQQLRGGLSPYFYLCTHQFTVLFRCLRSSDKTSWSALLSPSTRGLREMLTKEGIEFRLPNVRASQPSSTRKNRKCKDSSKFNNENDPPLHASQSSQHADSHGNNKKNKPVPENEGNGPDKQERADAENEDDDNDDDDEEDISDDDGASRWLEGMGLDKRDFPSLEPLKVKLQREGYREIDNRSQSMIYIEGVDVHPFFNFLLNYSACIAVSGPQHGVPPTILSPAPFVGGTLVQNTVRHTNLTDGHNAGKRFGKTSSNVHVFEISGPILPHHSLNIATILYKSPQCQSASMVYNTHNPSTAFNTQTENTEVKDKLASGLSKLLVGLSQAKSGLLQDVKDHLVSPLPLETGKYVKELTITQSGFLWSC